MVREHLIHTGKNITSFRRIPPIADSNGKYKIYLKIRRKKDTLGLLDKIGFLTKHEKV